MNRIDPRPAAPALNGNDGVQLQRHMLQELERQWLDNWGAAQAAQPDATPPSVERGIPPAETKPPATARGASGTPCFQTAGSPSGVASRQASDDAKRPVAEQHSGAAVYEKLSDASAAHRDVQRDQAFGATGPVQSVAATMPLPAQPQNAVGTWDGSAAHVGLESSSPPSSVAVTAVAAAVTSPDLIFAGRSAPPAQATGAEDADARPRARHTSPAADRTEGDIGPRKLTLRELAPNLVQATLRDTQLDLAASRLAAQGLARALMEAGYAQAKVIVNGQPSRGQATDGDDTVPSIPASPFTDTVSKEPIHGN